MKTLLLILLLPIISYSQQDEGVERYLLDRFKVDNDKRSSKTRSYFILFNKDSLWLMDGQENYVMKFDIYNDFVEGGMDILLVKNLTESQSKGRMIFEIIVIKNNELILCVWTGRIFALPHKGEGKRLF